jgi:hypothetical protein
MMGGIYCPNCGSQMPTEARFCMDCGRRIPTSPERIPILKRVRFEVFKRDMHTCVYCGRKSPDVVLHVDHVIPVAKGGTNDLSNLVTACEDCNRGKGAVPLSDTSLQAWEELRLAEQVRIAEEEVRLLKLGEEINRRATEILAPLSDLSPLIAFSDAIESGWPFLFSPYCELLDLAEQHMDGKTVTKRPINRALTQLKRFNRTDDVLRVQRFTSNIIIAQLLLNRVNPIRQRWNGWSSRLSEEKRKLLTVGPDDDSVYYFRSWSSVRDENRQALIHTKFDIGLCIYERSKADERRREIRRLAWRAQDFKEIATHLDYSVNADGPKLTLDEIGTSMKRLQDIVDAWSNFLRYRTALLELGVMVTPHPW